MKLVLFSQQAYWGSSFILQRKPIEQQHQQLLWTEKNDRRYSMVVAVKEVLGPRRKEARIEKDRKLNVCCCYERLLDANF